MVTNRENWRPSGPSSIAVPATRRVLGGVLEAGASSTVTVCGTAKGGIVSVAVLLPFLMVSVAPAVPTGPPPQARRAVPPSLPPVDAVIVTGPAPMARTRPFELTTATPASLVCQMNAWFETIPPVALIAVATSWKLSPIITGVTGTPVTTTDATSAGPVTWSSPQDMNETALAATQKRTKARRERGNSGV